jgi:hypothetical protein
MRLLRLVPLLCSLAAPAALAKEPQPSKEPQAAKLQYAAEMATTVPGQPPVDQKIFVSGGRIRTEMDMGGMQSVQVIDLDKQKTWMLMPGQKMVMEAPMNMSGAQGPVAGSQVKPGSSPCDARPGTTCKKQGQEEVAGRKATRWQLTEEDGTQSSYWIDESLGALLRYRSPQAEMEVKSIKEGPQPAQLFEVPKGYQVMQMPGMPGGVPPAAPGKRK